MNFHEYQAKQLFADYGIAVPKGIVARTPDEAVAAAKLIPGELWVVKAQIHAGGRGKAGGVKLAKSFDEVKQYSKAMLGSKMATYQTAGVELPIDSVLVCEGTDIANEMYLSILVDRASKTITFIACAEGGMDIEQVAKTNPSAIKSVHVDYVQGLPVSYTHLRAHET
jgi:succinyl-CoA synthetase beta subunit